MVYDMHCRTEHDKIICQIGTKNVHRRTQTDLQGHSQSPINFF